MSFTERQSELHVVGTSHECSYLPDQEALTEYRLVRSLTAERYEALLLRGWRRFGRTLFRPVCGSCQECRSLRVIVAKHQPSKSQRRCLKRNADVDLVVRPPTVTDEHLDLYNRYHFDMHRRRGWSYRTIDAAEYTESFLEGEFPFSREFLYYRNGRLVGIGLVDVLPTLMSSIYFIHDPDWRDEGPGTYSMLRELRYAADHGKDHHLLGFWIRENQSMQYKNRFHPHELLQGRPDLDEPAVWLP